MFKVFQILQLILGVVMWTLVGQGLLFLLLRERRRVNAIYQVMSWVTWPAMRTTRLLTPRFIVDEHIGFLAFLFVIALRLALYMFFWMQGWIPSIQPPEA